MSKYLPKFMNRLLLVRLKVLLLAAFSLAFSQF